MSLWRSIAGIAPAVAVLAAAPAAAQVTTSSLTGRITTSAGNAPVVGAQITAVHQPSGTTYRATTRADGRYTIPGMRVGGPYVVSVRALGYAPAGQTGVSLELGAASDLSFALNTAAVQLQTVQVTETSGATSQTRTGAATRVSSEVLATLPTIGRTLTDFVRITPQAGGNGSFAGQDNRANNITIDGSFFNNSFGLQGQPGARTNVSPLPLEALDQIQVNVAPYDVRQGNFVGAGVNAVTKSGTNNLEGAVYYNTRNQRFVGKKAGGAAYNPGTFDFGQVGVRLSGPVVQNKLFVFANFEDDKLQQPATSFVANTGGQTVGGNITRVQAADLDRLSQFLQQKLKYNPGPYTGYNFETPSRRFLAKVDYNANDRNKFSVRYTFLNSSADQPTSNSNSLGNGNRQGSTDALSFANSAYAIMENIRSVVGEWNSQYGSRASNNLIAGFTKNDESRKYKSDVLFPTVDILNGGTTYTSFGFEPFTPANQLRYRTYQLQDNFTYYLTKHDLTFGATFENYRSENVFYPGSQSVYVYNSLDDFFTDANDYLANPGRTVSPVTLAKFQVRYMNVPGLSEPLQPLEVNSYGAYAQDQWRVTPRMQLTVGLRMDVPAFKATAYANPQANAFTFRDENGNAVRYETQKLPGANPLWSPRLGFNWDARGDRSTVVRGGTGIFTGRPAYVWISNQIGQNGILTGFDQQTNTKARPFNPNPDAYKPTTVTGAPASSYELDFTDKDFRFPQTWRSNLAVDKQLPWKLLATVEYIYGRDVNGMAYINANLPAAQTRFSGPDQRPRWTSNRINAAANPGAYVLKNENGGSNHNIAASLERSFASGLFAKAAYSYGISKNTIDPGSIATGTYNGNPISSDPNNPPVTESAYSPGGRAFVALSYRKEYFKFGATGVSLFVENRTSGNASFGRTASYVFSTDANGDGAANDLIYIPSNTSEMNFVQFTTGNAAAGTLKTFTVAQQQAAYEAFIAQDKYLSKHRGEYAQRDAVYIPNVTRADLSLTQDIFRSLVSKRNNLQVRLDILNVGNLLNKNWGVGQRLVATNGQLLTNPTVDANGALAYRLRVISNELIKPQSFEKTAFLADVYRMQLGLRYSFQ